MQVGNKVARGGTINVVITIPVVAIPRTLRKETDMKTLRKKLATLCSMALVTGSAGVAAQVTVADSIDVRDSVSATATGALAGEDQRELARLSTRFGAFAGSNANARALALGLHTSGAITLDGQGSTGATTFTPATKAMGYGSVNIALLLAMQSLSKAGIEKPTPQQIQAALNGGIVSAMRSGTNSTALLPGVLALRSKGNGWGTIAQSVGAKLGRLESRENAGRVLIGDSVVTVLHGGESVTATLHRADDLVSDGASVALHAGDSATASLHRGAMVVSGSAATALNGSESSAATLRGATLIAPPTVGANGAFSETQRAMGNIRVGR